MKPRIVELCAVDFSIWHMLKRLCFQLQKQGFQVSTAASPGKYTPQIVESGIEFFPLQIQRNLNVFSHIKSLWTIRRFVLKNRINIVHVHTPIASLLARAAMLGMKRPIIAYTVHGFYFHENMPPLKRKIHIFLERLFGNITDLMFYQSKEDFELAHKLRIAPKAKHTWIGNGIDLKRFERKDSHECRQKLGVPSDACVIATVGRLVGEKGYRELIASFADIATRHPNIWLIAAAPTLENAHDQLDLQKLMENLSPEIQARIKFFDYIEDVPSFLSATDIFVLPSYREGVPRSVIEAMATGCPCVVTNIRGCRELIQDQKGGFIVEPKSVKSLTSGLEKILNLSAEKRAEQGAFNKKYAYEFCDETKIVNLQVGIFEKLCDETMKKIAPLWLCHFFYPDVSAPSARALKLLTYSQLDHWNVLTTFPHHPDNRLPEKYRRKFWQKDNLDVTTKGNDPHKRRVPVLRTFIWLPQISNLFRQTTGHITFALSSLLFFRNGSRRPINVVISSSPTLFSAVSGWILARIYRARFVLEIRDLWPSIFSELGVLKNPSALKVLTWLELFLYRRADRIVSVTEGFRHDIHQRSGVPLERISLIRNCADFDSIYPRTKRIDETPFTVGYVGTVGRSQGVPKILQYWCNADIPGRFLVVGNGIEIPALMKVKERYPHKNIEIRDPVAFDQILPVYHELDVGIVCLKPIPLFKSFIPSKIFELMAVGVPILGILDGEAADIVNQHGVGLVSSPDNETETKLHLQKFYQQHLDGTISRYGIKGRETVKQEFSAERFAKLYDDLLLEEFLAPRSL